MHSYNIIIFIYDIILSVHVSRRLDNQQNGQSTGAVTKHRAAVIKHRALFDTKCKGKYLH